MVKSLSLAGIAAVFGCALLALPGEVAARTGASGIGTRPAASRPVISRPGHTGNWNFHHRPHRHAHFHRRFYALPYYVGAAPDYVTNNDGYTDSSYSANSGYDNEASDTYAAPALTAPRCQHSEETVTVRAERGGTRQILISRC